MLHLVFYALLAILLGGGLFLIASRLLPAGEQIAPSLRDEPPWELPAERHLLADDVDGVRLPVALRGYRFAETDLLLDRLATELRDREAELAQLRGYPDPSGEHASLEPAELRSRDVEEFSDDISPARHRAQPPGAGPLRDAAALETSQAALKHPEHPAELGGNEQPP